jgi:hypothetical protein
MHSVAAQFTILPFVLCTSDCSLKFKGILPITHVVQKQNKMLKTPNVVTEVTQDNS